MDIYSYLKKDHKKVNSLFKQIINTKNTRSRKKLFQVVKQELLLHAKAEQATFYKALENNDKSSEKVEHAIDEHSEIKKLLNKIDKIQINKDQWLVDFGVLKYQVEHHVKEEEGELFDKAKKILDSEQANELVQKIEEYKQRNHQ